MPDTDAITAFRSFSRFYTREIELLGEGLLDSAFTLPEARILYELAHRENANASMLARDLRHIAAELAELALDSHPMVESLKPILAPYKLVSREMHAHDTVVRLVRRGWIRGGTHGTVTLENRLPSELPLSRRLLDLPAED